MSKIMITINISFLIAFSLAEPKLEQDVKKKDNEEKPKKNKTAKNVDENSEVIEEKIKYMFEVGNPLKFLHIEYELIPGRPKYQIDVVCWGSIAKIYSFEEEITLKTLIENEIVWIPISVKHILNQLDDTELVKLHSHVINYNIATSKNKLGARNTPYVLAKKLAKRAKAEKTKTFFIHEEDVDSELKFVEAFHVDPNIDNFEKNKYTDLENEIRNIIWECAEQPGKLNREEIISKLEFLKHDTHVFQINKTIDYARSRKKIRCKDFVLICPPPINEVDESKKIVSIDAKNINIKEKIRETKSIVSTKKDTKSTKTKSANEKNKKDGAFQISVPGEVLFTDPTLSIYTLEDASSEVHDFYVLQTVSNLLNRPQKYSFNPLIIKIKKLSNLPINILAQHRFHSIYAYYNIPFIAQCSTIEKPLDKKIIFNEAHVHFTDTVPKLKLVEFMQTQRLFVEIRGVREEYIKPTEPHLFGREKNDCKLSNRLSPRECANRLNYTYDEPSSVTLAIAAYDISSLLKPVWDFKEVASCHLSDIMLYEKPNCMYEEFKFTDTLTINEINLSSLSEPKNSSPLTEYLLNSYGTTLQIEVYLSAPLRALLEVHSDPQIFNRLFFIIENTELAAMFLNFIMLHNQDILGPDIFIANFLKCHLQQADLDEISRRRWHISTDYSVYSPALTGFIIDNGNSYAFFVEGLANGYITRLWSLIVEYQHNITKVFYNTDFCFEKRIYNEFFKFGGVYMINLSRPLAEILKEELVYLEGNIPRPCWKALKKLNILFKCETLRSAIQYCLFPTCIQLVSLDFEYGVPFKWKPSEIEQNRLNQASDARTTQIFNAQN